MEVRRQLLGVGLFFPLCASHGSNSSQQNWQQAPLLSEPSPWPRIAFPRLTVKYCLVLFSFFSLSHQLLVRVINYYYLNIIDIVHPLHLVPYLGEGGRSIKTLMLWTRVWVPCVWEAWALTWNTKELVPKKTILSMLELRQHMCILCKMYMSGKSCHRARCQSWPGLQWTRCMPWRASQ